MATNYIYKVTENNGGGLTLNIWTADGRYIYAHSGYEYNRGQLSQDIASLEDGDDPRDWDGNDLTDEEIVRATRETQTHDGYLPADDSQIFDADGNIIPLTEDEYYDNHESTQIIYDNTGPAEYDIMGNAGAAEFYPDGE